MEHQVWYNSVDTGHTGSFVTKIPRKFFSWNWRNEGGGKAAWASFTVNMPIPGKGWEELLRPRPTCVPYCWGPGTRGRGCVATGPLLQCRACWKTGSEVRAYIQRRGSILGFHIGMEEEKWMLRVYWACAKIILPEWGFFCPPLAFTFIIAN